MIGYNLYFEWEKDDDYPGFLRTRLRAPYTTGPVLRLGGVPQHVQAIQVRRDEMGCQCAVNQSYAEEIDMLQTLADGAVVTNEIPGHEGDWVIYAQPHGD